MKGRNNTAVDFLSRIDCEVDNQVNKESEFIDRFIYNMSTSGDFLDEILEEQTNNPAISFVAEQLNERANILSDVTKPANRTVRWIGKTRKSYSGNRFTRIHNASHPGIKRTFYLLKEQFTWNGMHNYVRKFCQDCCICQREKVRLNQESH